MNDRELLYRTSVAGSFAGFLAWAIREQMPGMLRRLEESRQLQNAAAIADQLDFVLIGALMCAVCVLLAAGWWGERSYFRRGLKAILALFLGALGGLVAAGLFQWLRSRQAPGASVLVSLLIAWAFLGAWIGFFIGLFRGGVLRMFVGAVAGLAGGLLGGAITAWTAPWVAYIHVVSLTFTGLMIAFFVGLGIVLVTKARLVFVSSQAPAVVGQFQQMAAMISLVRGDTYLFGSGSPSGPFQFVPLDDPRVASLHAWLRYRKNHFYLVPHRANQDASGWPVDVLMVERGPERIEPNGKTDGVVLEHDDVIVIGTTRFRFLSHKQKAVPEKPLVTAAGILLLAAMVLPGAPAFSQILEQPEKAVLCEYGRGSERPALRVSLSVVDSHRNPMKVPVLDPAAIRVLAGDQPLEIVSHPWGPASIERYAIVLLDVSGSMRGPDALGDVKFDAAVAAARAFAEDFVNGVDHVAIVPFGSRGVAAGVHTAPFQQDRVALLQFIKDLPEPQSTSNTGLFTALRAALERIEALKKEHQMSGGVIRQYMVIALTDGRNAFNALFDDADLLASPEPVRRLAAQVGAQVFTVGFGNAQNLDEPTMRALAWPASNYLPAADAAALRDALRKARSLQLERLNLTFLFQEALRVRLRTLDPYRFRVEMKLPDRTISGDVLWESATKVSAPPFEDWIPVPQPSHGARLYLLIVFAGGVLHYIAGILLPRRIWRDYHDLKNLREQALVAFKASRNDFGNFVR
jgi:hypothetical protein